MFSMIPTKLFTAADALERACYGTDFRPLVTSDTSFTNERTQRMEMEEECWPALLDLVQLSG